VIWIVGHSAVQGVIARSGGIRPPKRKRSRLALTIAEREKISRGIVAGPALRSIASRLRRAPSTVSLELKRNGGRRRYRANKADKAAWQRARRPKTCKLAQNRVLARIVAEKLDDLQELVHPGPRGLEEGAATAPEEDARHAPLAPQDAQG
jgi:hypothetical protein